MSDSTVLKLFTQEFLPDLLKLKYLIERILEMETRQFAQIIIYYEIGGRRLYINFAFH